MKILHVCSELYPLIKTGGLADVLGALPWAQQAQGSDVRVVMPYYPQVAERVPDTHEVTSIDTFAGAVTVRYGEYQELGMYFVDAPQCFAREGNPYHDDNYEDYHDNFRRFALLSFMGAAIASGLDNWWGRVDILHAHDWQAGLACAYLKHWQSPVRSVFTIHNLAYQGMFAAYHIEQIDLPWSMFATEGLEFNGELSYLKAGLFYADKITTVSPTYADEITRELGGYGLQGLLELRAIEERLQGILNGVDERAWNPQTDSNISKQYGVDSFGIKADNKRALQQQFALAPSASVLTLVMVARLTEQKGADIVLSGIEAVLDLPIQLVVLGSGAPLLEQGFQALAQTRPKQVGVKIGYDEALAHQIIAGGDVILVPSRFEPCGLTQLYGLKYGTLPLVRACGGLADTVIDADEQALADNSATGFVFSEATGTDFAQAVRRAYALWQQPKQWWAVCKYAMQQDYSWARSAQSYCALYETIV